MILSMLVLTLMFSMLTNVPCAVETGSLTRGPRTEDLVINFYNNVSSAYAALKTGEIDILGYELTKKLYQDAVADPNIALAPVTDLGMYQFDLNNNWTIATYPSIRSPMSYRRFRQALAFLTDKDYIVNMIIGGLAERIDQPLGAPKKGWTNRSMYYPNYPYEYSPLSAAAKLDDAGFIQGSTLNPYYDPAYPRSAMYIRTYPPDHSKKGEDLDPLECCIRTDDTRRLYAGRLLYQNLRKLGVPCNPTEGTMAILYDKVMGNFDYHIYTGGWSGGGKFPTPIYYLYHSSFWSPYGANYVTGMNESNLPNYPKLDQLLCKVRYPEDDADALSSCRRALGLFTELAITIPLWSSRAFWAYSTNVLGVVNMEGCGPENGYTFMNAYKVDGSPIRYGLKSAPVAMNIIYSDWFYDYQCLDRMNLYSAIAHAPYSLSINQAGFVRDWEVGIWNNGGANKTKLTKWFRDDAYFVKPVTGNRRARVNATHYLFAAWYESAIEDSWSCRYWWNIHHINVVNDFQVEVYFDAFDYWYTYAAGGPMLPIDVWLQPPLAHCITETFTEGVDLTTPGPLGLSGKPVWIEKVTAGSALLTMFIDYNIVKGQLEILVNLTGGTAVEVDYWAVGDANGFTPGNLPWQIMFEDAGMYYATDFVAGVGGFLLLKRNPYYWMKTPPLGEVDFVWKWENGAKPRSGSYRIDIFDIVRAAGAYGSQGTGVPDKDWLSGADVAPPSGIIDIYDLATVASKYGQTWGHTP